jgi:hypothetical protein
MAYETGSASDLAGLLAFIRSSCTAHGWTLSGNVLWKGGTYVEILLDGTVGVKITGGNGIDGSNNLTTPCPESAYLGTIAGVALSYPMTVEAHINTSPDEVYIVINHTTNYYSLMAWGKSDVPGLTGSGVWFHATRTWKTGTDNFNIDEAGVSTVTNFGTHLDGAALFSIYTGDTSSGGGGVNNSFIHADVDSLGWHDGSGDFPTTFACVTPLQKLLPNAWNNETILLPYPVYVPRTSGDKNTLVADLKHIRLLRIDYHEPEDLITLGSDTWRVYPWFRKDVTDRDGGSELSHSGSFGYAVRYTGP